MSRKDGFCGVYLIGHTNFTGSEAQIGKRLRSCGNQSRVRPAEPPDLAVESSLATGWRLEGGKNFKLFFISLFRSLISMLATFHVNGLFKTLENLIPSPLCSSYWVSGKISTFLNSFYSSASWSCTPHSNNPGLLLSIK